MPQVRRPSVPLRPSTAKKTKKAVWGGHREVFESGGGESSEADWAEGHDRPSTSPSSRLLLCKGWWLHASQFVRAASTGCELAQITFRGPYFWERPGTLPWHIWSLIFPLILKGDCYFPFPGGKSMIQRNIKFCVQSHTAGVTGYQMESFPFLILWPAPQSCGHRSCTCHVLKEMAPYCLARVVNVDHR